MCVCDLDIPKVQITKHRTARKPHICGECGRTIKPGEFYQVDRVLGDEWSEHKTCCDCEAIVWWVRGQQGCDCIPFGELRETLDYLGCVNLRERKSEESALVFQDGRIVPSAWLKADFEAGGWARDGLVRA